MSTSLKLYGPLFSPYVRAVRLYAAELGLSLDAGMAPFGEKIEFRSAQHLAINPFGKVPVLIDDDFKLFETAAICRYLDALAGERSLLQGLSLQEQALTDQWSSAVSVYARQHVMDGFLLELAFPKGEDGQPRMEIVMGNLSEARMFVTLIESRLAQSTWLAGDDYSLADSMLTPFLDFLDQVPVLDHQHGKLIADGSACQRYLQAVRQRASAQVLQQR